MSLGEEFPREIVVIDAHDADSRCSLTSRRNRVVPKLRDARAPAELDPLFRSPHAPSQDGIVDGNLAPQSAL